jgi:hypothetical protein
MTAAGAEPANPASELPQTHALDRVATGIRRRKITHSIQRPLNNLHINNYLLRKISEECCIDLTQRLIQAMHQAAVYRSFQPL